MLSHGQFGAVLEARWLVPPLNVGHHFALRLASTIPEP